MPQTALCRENWPFLPLVWNRVFDARSLRSGNAESLAKRRRSSEAVVQKAAKSARRSAQMGGTACGRSHAVFSPRGWEPNFAHSVAKAAASGTEPRRPEPWQFECATS